MLSRHRGSDVFAEQLFACAAAATALSLQRTFMLPSAAAATSLMMLLRPALVRVNHHRAPQAARSTAMARSLRVCPLRLRTGCPYQEVGPTRLSHHTMEKSGHHVKAGLVGQGSCMAFGAKALLAASPAETRLRVRGASTQLISAGTNRIFADLKTLKCSCLNTHNREHGDGTSEA